MTVLSASAVWPTSPEALLALAERLGEPVDSYLNGSQVWLAASGPGGVVFEWRLHPAAEYRLPAGLSHYDLWSCVVEQLADDGDPAALVMGGERRSLESIWDGLEVFPAYGDEVEPAVLAEAASAALGLRPTTAGLVDHTRIADAWERAGRTTSIFAALLDELANA